MIRFDYRLRSHGWAKAVIAREGAEVSIPASYLCDALRDFVDAIQSLFITESAECIWEEEPGQFRWEFRRIGPGCVVSVFRNNEEHAVFSGEEDLLHFSSEVESVLRKLLEEWGEDGYLNQWGYAFPREAHDKLRQAIKTERDRQKAAGKGPSPNE